ncbi:Chymotrypsinogen B [Trichinella pseudospiralis]|uniref:Chymotrypsinogen B n=1 Tax=Trichinella pseudospiralis TaxID=6337 RepID=A0A0V1FLN0_TRIPS|nr:Chymotrypsinogen B [Trichinella pseudospiralis]KRY86922.1 Chymotrypsinogen B [Trichinella pseudospiralis]
MIEVIFVPVWWVNDVVELSEIVVPQFIGNSAELLNKLNFVFDMALQSSGRKWRTVDDGLCGRPKYNATFPDSANRITGGEQAIPHSHPWLVYISTKNTLDRCGGFILPSSEVNSSSYVLTAAHCVRNLIDSDLIVTAGIHDISLTSENGRQVAHVSKIIKDSKYTPGNTKNRDYAVLVLSAPLQFTDYVLSVCLPDIYEYLEPRTACLVAGWGGIDGGVYKPKIEKVDGISRIILRELVPTTKLMQAVLKVSSNSFCEDESVFSTAFDSSINLCAGDVLGEKGINNLDSGGPLVCLKDGIWVAYGISVGRLYTHETQPSLFVKTSELLDFLKEVSESIIVKAKY